MNLAIRIWRDSSCLLLLNTIVTTNIYRINRWFSTIILNLRNFWTFIFVEAPIIVWAFLNSLWIFVPNLYVTLASFLCAGRTYTRAILITSKGWFTIFFWFIHRARGIDYFFFHQHCFHLVELFLLGLHQLLFNFFLVKFWEWAHDDRENQIDDKVRSKRDNNYEEKHRVDGVTRSY